MTAPQPGWYPFPGRPGEARWWDGAAWTEHHQPIPQTLPAPVAEPAREPEFAFAPALPTPAPRPAAPVNPFAGPAGGTAQTPRPRPEPVAAVPATKSGDSRNPFIRAMSDGFTLAFKWSGRASRADYWYFYLVQIILSVVVVVGAGAVVLLLLASTAAGDSVAPDGTLVSAPTTTGLPIGFMIGAAVAGLLFLYMSIASWGVLVRRLHDIGKSGWNALLTLLPVLNVVLTILWGVAEGEGRNQYGERA